MKSITIVADTSIDTTLPSPGDATYQSECLALQFRRNLKLLADSAFQMQSPETTDFATMVADVEAFETSFDSWLDSAVTAQMEETSVPALPSGLPVLSTILAALLSGGQAVILPVLVNVALRLVLRIIEKRFDADTDTSEVVHKLEELRAQIESTLTEFTINLHGSEMDSSWGVGPVGED